MLQAPIEKMFQIGIPHKENTTKQQNCPNLYRLLLNKVFRPVNQDVPIHQPIKSLHPNSTWSTIHKRKFKFSKGSFTYIDVGFLS